jgi:hypothetical protein
VFLSLPRETRGLQFSFAFLSGNADLVFYNGSSVTQDFPNSIRSLPGDGKLFACNSRSSIATQRAVSVDRGTFGSGCHAVQGGGVLSCSELGSKKISSLGDTVSLRNDVAGSDFIATNR